jgi:hypothetical protein
MGSTELLLESLELLGQKRLHDWRVSPREAARRYEREAGVLVMVMV